MTSKCYFTVSEDIQRPNVVKAYFSVISGDENIVCEMVNDIAKELCIGQPVRTIIAERVTFKIEVLRGEVYELIKAIKYISFDLRLAIDISI